MEFQRLYIGREVNRDPIPGLRVGDPVAVLNFPGNGKLWSLPCVVTAIRNDGVIVDSLEGLWGWDKVGPPF